MSKKRFLVLTTTSSKPAPIAQTSCCSVRARKWPWPAPVAAGPADPAVEHAAIDEVDGVAEAVDQVVQLRIGLRPGGSRDRPCRRPARPGRDRRAAALGHQDDVVAVAQPPGDFGGGLAAAELPEPLLDVLDLERTLFEVVVADQVFHGSGVRPRRPSCLRRRACWSPDRRNRSRRRRRPCPRCP